MSTSGQHDHRKPAAKSQLRGYGGLWNPTWSPPLLLNLPGRPCTCWLATGRGPTTRLANEARRDCSARVCLALTDLPQQLLEWDAGLFCPALAEVVAVADQSGAVLRDAAAVAAESMWSSPVWATNATSACGAARIAARTPAGRGGGGSRLCWRCSWPRFNLDPPPRSLVWRLRDPGLVRLS